MNRIWAFDPRWRPEAARMGPVSEEIVQRAAEVDKESIYFFEEDPE